MIKSGGDSRVSNIVLICATVWTVVVLALAYYKCADQQRIIAELQRELREPGTASPNYDHTADRERLLREFKMGNADVLTKSDKKAGQPVQRRQGLNLENEYLP